MLCECFQGLRGRVFGVGELGEDLAGLAEGDARAVLQGLCDETVLGGEGGDVVVEDFGVGVRVEVGCYCEKFCGGRCQFGEGMIGSRED